MIGNDWDLILKDEFHKPYFIKLVNFLNEECKKKVIYPKSSDLFKALKETSYKDVKVSAVVDVPAYCYNCGKPYPWTEATLQTAEHIIDMLDELTPDQKKQLVDFIPDIIVETPQSRYAALVYANFLDGLQGLAVDCFKDWCKKNVFPTLLVLLNMQKQ